jgi:hypothetical protein
MENARYFEEQSQRCYRLARGCCDLLLAEQLNALGNEFRQKAHEMGTEWVARPPVEVE